MRLEVSGLSKNFGSKVAVADLSFSIEPGTVTGLLGPNGSGKSTTIKMISGLIEPTRGSIFWNGLPIGSDKLRFKGRLGYVPEEPHLYSYLSGMEYLQLVGYLRGIHEQVLHTRIERLLRLFSLFPMRFRRIGSYSKGMKQKVLLCAALIHNPDLLVLDEPLSGLDVNSVLVLENLLPKLALSGKTVLYSSHILGTVEKLCTKVVIIQKGKLIADTQVEAIRRLKGDSTFEKVFSDLALEEDPCDVADQIVQLVEEGG
ncbi:MAG: ABC transporter ATP-binding protein [Acidobacteriota bacterium]|nr:MAG: ABC transporter ATP-binding protein [Acidobacteriota bacterium]